MKRHLLYLIAGLLALGSGLCAQEVVPPVPPPPAVAPSHEQKPAPPSATPAPVATEKPESPIAPPTPVAETNATVSGATDEKIVIDYREADMQNVVRTLAAKAGVNLIVGEAVVGKVTVHLEDVGYEDAMRLIVESKGYAFVKNGNVIQIKTKESLDAEPVVAQLVSLNYAKADDVKKTLDPLMTRQGKIQVDVRGNALILLDTPSSLAKMIPLIEKIDTQTTQVMIEAKFVETTKNPKQDLGINWSGTLLNHQLAAGNPTAGGVVTTDPTTGAPIGGLQFSKNLAGGPWVPSTALLDAGAASVLFSYLNSDADTELLATPRVVTTDNTKAKIAIAQEYPIPQFTYSETKGAFTISGFEYKDIGIVLNCTPHINKSEFVTLDVEPQAGSQDGAANFQGINIPIIDNRTASTTVLIKSGNTLAMGGLMRLDQSDSHTKVPILGDLPGIGAFFRSKSLSKTKRDLLIFLTPTIIAPDGKTGYEKYYNGLPKQKVTAGDTWMPTDNATPDPANLEPWKKQTQPNQNFAP